MIPIHLNNLTTLKNQYGFLLGTAQIDGGMLRKFNGLTSPNGQDGRTQ